jgi:hypothetical protein
VKPPDLHWDYKMLFVGNEQSSPLLDQRLEEGWRIISVDHGRALLRRIQFPFYDLDAAVDDAVEAGLGD